MSGLGQRLMGQGQEEGNLSLVCWCICIRAHNVWKPKADIWNLLIARFVRQGLLRKPRACSGDHTG